MNHMYPGHVSDVELSFGQVLPKGSLLANDMSEAILKLGENGTLRQLEKKWFPVSLSNYAAPDDDSNQSLGLSNYTYMFVISSCLAFLTVLHRYIEAIYHSTADQQEPRDQQPPPQGVELVPLPREGPVQQRINNQGEQEAEMEDVPLNEVHNVPEIEPTPLPREIVEIEDPLQNRIVPDGAYNIGHQPLELHNDNIQPDMNGPRQRFRHAASSSNISMPARVLLSFLSFRPRHIQEIEWQRLRDSAQHELENPPNSGLHNNDHQPGSSSFEQRFQSAASSSNILRTNRVQRAQSLDTRTAQENKNLQDASHDTEVQPLLNESHKGGEPASVLRSDAEPGLSNNLRRRPKNA